MLTLTCPATQEQLAANAVERHVSKHLTHTERGYVLPGLGAALQELRVLDCVIQVPAAPVAGSIPSNRLPCLCVVSGKQVQEAKVVLERLAQLVVELDPDQLITLKEARLLFNL